MARGISIVIPTVARPSLAVLLAVLTGGAEPRTPVEVLIVDDRRDHRTALPLPLPARGRHIEARGRRVEARGHQVEAKVLTGRSAGPAAARNDGWRAARHDWVAFLDDDVLPDADWLERLIDDLEGAAACVGGVQGDVRVPLPAGRRPTDWERVTAGLADGAWITADMAYRRSVLAQVGGFDERLPRAFREDAELAYRVRAAGWILTRGRRAVSHPVRPESRWVSVRAQAGNADDALLRRLYGRRWRALLDIPPGRRPRHLAITAAGLIALGCAATGALTGRRGWWRGARVAVAGWTVGTVEFAAARIIPGPRTAREVGTMIASSAAIPVLASAHWLCGWCRWRGVHPAGRSR